MRLAKNSGSWIKQQVVTALRECRDSEARIARWASTGPRFRRSNLDPADALESPYLHLTYHCIDVKLAVKKRSHTETEARRDRIVDAASTTFLRYGFARTTLGTIAHAANVHRPALYAHFPGGKDELFEVVLLRLVESAVERYRKHVRSLPSLHQQLTYCVEQWSMAGYRLTEMHPESRDAFDLAYPAVRKMYDVLIAFYAELLDDSVSRSAVRLSANEFARLLVFSLRGIREAAYDAGSMRRLLKQEVDVFLAAVSVV